MGSLRQAYDESVRRHDKEHTASRTIREVKRDGIHRVLPNRLRGIDSKVSHSEQSKRGEQGRTPSLPGIPVSHVFKSIVPSGFFFGFAKKP